MGRGFKKKIKDKKTKKQSYNLFSKQKKVNLQQRHASAGYAAQFDEPYASANLHPNASRHS